MKVWHRPWWTSQIQFRLAAPASFYLCALVIAASLLLGGSTRAGFLSDAILQLLAIPLFFLAASRLFDEPLTKQCRWAAWFCLAVVLTPILQLIPLPPTLWTSLPSRGPSRETFALLGQNPPWMPISVAPHATWLSALSLLPPLAVFLAVLQFGYRERRMLSLLVLAIGIVSVFVGLIQVAQGPSSPLRFFEITNPTEAVGFFANRNHFAALLYCLMLLAAAWAAEPLAAMGMVPDRKHNDTFAIVALIAGFTVLVIFVAGEAMARSRAGLGLSIVALLGAFVIAAFDKRVKMSHGRGVFRLTATKLMVGAIALGVIFAVQYALYRILERFGTDPLEDARIPFARNTTEAAAAFMPFGSGLGTFIPVYSMFEKPADALANKYANHAHNDILQLWLDTGVIGLALMGVFAVWLALRSVQVWRRAQPCGASQLDRSLARAASIAVALIFVHSFVDYPLRTGAMMALVAFLCGLLFEPTVAANGREAAESHQRTRKRARQPARRWEEPALATHAPQTRQSDQPVRRSENPPHSKEWRSVDIDWPEAWRSSGDSSPSATTGKASGRPYTPD
jgi:O-antigen ligase